MTYQVTKAVTFDAKLLREFDVVVGPKHLLRVEHVALTDHYGTRVLFVRVGAEGRLEVEYRQGQQVTVAADFEWVATEPYYEVAA